MQFARNTQTGVAGDLGRSVSSLDDFAPESAAQTPDTTISTARSPSTVLQPRPPAPRRCFRHAHFPTRGIQFP